MKQTMVRTRKGICKLKCMVGRHRALAQSLLKRAAMVTEGRVRSHDAFRPSEKSPLTPTVNHPSNRPSLSFIFHI